MAGIGGAAQGQIDPFPYQIIDLGPLGFDADENEIGTFDINDLHQVAYGREVGGVTRPFVWLPFDDPTLDPSLSPGANDLLALFPIPGFTTGIAFDINDHGIVVGQVGGIERGVAGSRAVWWDLRNGTSGLISPPSGGGAFGTDWSRARALTETDPPNILVETWRSDICRPECENPPQDPPVPLVFGSATSVTLPDSVASVSYTGIDCATSIVAGDIADSGAGPQIFGGSDVLDVFDQCIKFTLTCQAERNALVIDVPTGMLTRLQDADLLPPPETRGSQARGVSSGGTAVGWAITDDGSFCRRGAALWTSPASFLDLHAASGLNDGSGVAKSVAEGISDDVGSLIVGRRSDLNLPLLWINQGTGIYTSHLLDAIGGFNPGSVSASSCLGAVPAFAYDVNASGWIVAVGEFAGADHAYVLAPRRIGCGADQDGNGNVNFDDLLLLLNGWGPVPVCGFDAGDLNVDGLVGFDDLIILLAGWCPDGQDLADVPQTVQDCIDKFGFDPIALEACIATLPSP